MHIPRLPSPTDVFSWGVASRVDVQSCSNQPSTINLRHHRTPICRASTWETQHDWQRMDISRKRLWQPSNRAHASRVSTISRSTDRDLLRFQSVVSAISICVTHLENDVPMASFGPFGANVGNISFHALTTYSCVLSTHAVLLRILYHTEIETLIHTDTILAEHTPHLRCKHVKEARPGR